MFFGKIFTLNKILLSTDLSTGDAELLFIKSLSDSDFHEFPIMVFSLGGDSPAGKETTYLGYSCFLFMDDGC